ncbi:MAG: helix-turn-helix domain-containing protein [bacterium]|nr:helix-turn-helix domain-containing protein [bacterium]
MTKRKRQTTTRRKAAKRPKARPATATARAHRPPAAAAEIKWPLSPIPAVSAYGQGTVKDTRVVFVQADEWEGLMDWIEDVRSAERFAEARREPPGALIPYAEVKRRLWGNHIKKIRKEKGIKQKDLAERLGCQPSYVAKIEKPDYRAWASTLERVAEALGCEVTDLI